MIGGGGGPVEEPGDPDDLAYAVALAGLPGIGPASLRRLVGPGPARPRFERLAAGRISVVEIVGSSAPGPRLAKAAGALRRWEKVAASLDPAALHARHLESGIVAFRLGAADYPPELADEPTAPAVLFATGRSATGHAASERAGAPKVALVGTRSSTHYGDSVAASLGSALAGAGVVVVSGLATGIDAAAHLGALAPGALAPPLAITGGGVDVVYPRNSARLFERVASHGVIFSEAAPGAPPERWRFPLRNRLIAAIADVLVVVESHEAGGSMHTVEAADARGVPIAAVPGSVRSPASAGTNALIADGAHLVRDADDVLALLGLVTAGARGAQDCRRPSATGSPGAGTSRSAVPPSPALRVGDDLPDDVVERAIDDTPTTLDEVLTRTGLELGAAAASLERLVATGRLRRCGACFERAAW